MVAVISCSHFPDDERIYHREISALLEKNYVIKYFTLSDQKTNLSQPGIDHKNYDLSKVTSDEPLDSITDPVAKTSDPAQSKLKVAVPPVVSLACA